MLLNFIETSKGTIQIMENKFITVSDFRPLKTDLKTDEKVMETLQ